MFQELEVEQIKELIRLKRPSGALRELIFCEGKCVRVSYSVNSIEAQECIQIINERFPEYSQYVFTSPKNLIGIGVAYKEPYVNEFISLYSYMDLPNKICEQFGIDKNERVYRNYFGLKFDLTTNKILCKVFYGDNQIIENLGRNIGFIGVYFNQEKQMLDDVDVYSRYVDIIKINETIKDDIIYDLYSLVMDSKTKQVKKIKGYKVFNNN